MREKDLAVVNEVLKCLQDGTIVDRALLEKFTEAVGKFNAEIEKRKERYFSDPELFRERSKQWRKNNADRKTEYDKEYSKRDYVIAREKKRKQEKKEKER